MTRQTRDLSEPASFYSLIREITARLVAAQGAELEVAVDDCLAQMGEHFDVAVVALGAISKSGEIIPSVHVREPGPSGSASVTVDPPPGPEMVARWNSDGFLIYNRLEDLDHLPQFQQHTRNMGIIAGVFWKYRDHGSHVEGLAMSYPSPRTWPDDIIERLGTVGEVVFNALHRRRAEMEAERLRRFEKVVADAASSFVHLPPDRVDEEIDTTLRRVCECVDADSGALLQWSDPQRSTLTVSHEWQADFVEGPQFHGAEVSENFPWLAARLREATPLFISEPDDFPPEATAERETCGRFGIHTIVWTPFVAAHGLQGYIALTTINRAGPWLEGVVPRLGLVGNVFASAIEHRRADLELVQAYRDIKELRDHLEAENVTLREEIESSAGDSEFIGKSPALTAVLHQVEQVARTDSTVLILGETGTGKGLVARRIHGLGGRKDHPMVTVNCAALPSELIESELFGHEKGAFTGAVSKKIGRFELADGGSIFLDEVGDLPLELQAKLLRILQDYEFERLGSSTTRKVDTRVIAATNRDLDALIEKGAFREDLYYRLGVFPIRIPPLRERRDDIPLLVWYFITNLQNQLGKTFETIPDKVMAALVSQKWPGNVRELRNILERGMILSPGPTLLLKDILPLRPTGVQPSERVHERPGANLEEVERSHIITVLDECGWKVRGQDGAAERLGLKRSTLQSRMKKLGIQRPTN